MRSRRRIPVFKRTGVCGDRYVERFRGVLIDGCIHRLQQFEYQRTCRRSRRIDGFQLCKGAALHVMVDAHRHRCCMKHVLALFDAAVVAAVHRDAQIGRPGRLLYKHTAVVQKLQIPGTIVLQQDKAVLSHRAETSA